MSIGQLSVGALLIAPFALAQLPAETPVGEGRRSRSLALGVLGSGIAYLLYFALIASAGASRAILVTYLVPAFALVYGAAAPRRGGHGVGARGLALILGGTALATGARPRRSGSVAEVNRYWPLILVLAAVWGASYLFIKVAVEGGLEPAPLMGARAAIAALVLLGYLARTIGARRAVARAARLLAPVGRARRRRERAPVLARRLGREARRLRGRGDRAVDGAALHVLLGLRFLPHEPLSRVPADAGSALGLVGVAVLAGGAPGREAGGPSPGRSPSCSRHSPTRAEP